MNHIRAATITTPGDRQIVVTRLFDAPRPVVFEARTKAEHVAHWWDPSGVPLAVCEIELKGANTGSDDDFSSAKQRVLDLAKEWVAAQVKRDATTLRRILDDKFVATFGAGQPYDKEAFIKLICSGDVDPTESPTLTDETVIVDGDTAVVVGTDILRGTKSGAAPTEAARYTVTYIRRNGQRAALAEHSVEVPQTK